MHEIDLNLFFKISLLSYLGIKLDQIEEDHILPLGPDGSVERVLGLCLKHLIQQGGRHVFKVLAGKIIL